jgi:hypothetical protein
VPLEFRELQLLTNFLQTVLLQITQKSDVPTSASPFLVFNGNFRPILVGCHIFRVLTDWGGIQPAQNLLPDVFASGSKRKLQAFFCAAAGQFGVVFAKAMVPPKWHKKRKED